MTATQTPIGMDLSIDEVEAPDHRTKHKLRDKNGSGVDPHARSHAIPSVLAERPAALHVLLREAPDGLYRDAPCPTEPKFLSPERCSGDAELRSGICVCKT